MAAGVMKVKSAKDFVKKLEFTDTEVYTKVEGNWRKEPKYIDEFLPKINISFNSFSL